jgi:hypothetical protein
LFRTITRYIYLLSATTLNLLGQLRPSFDLQRLFTLQKEMPQCGTFDLVTLVKKDFELQRLTARE